MKKKTPKGDKAFWKSGTYIVKTKGKRQYATPGSLHYRGKQTSFSPKDISFPSDNKTR